MASLTYDPFGRRQAKTIGGTTTNFLYDGLNPAQELSGATVNANLLTGPGIDEYFTRTDALGTSNFLTDALGSTAALADTPGTVQTSYTFEPFGNTTAQGGSNANSYQFTGRENDGNGLYFYRARYYGPSNGRFLSEDPKTFRADINFYRYAFSSPVDLGDPLGLQGGGNANTWTFGEIGSWAWLPAPGYPAPTGLGDAKASIGPACALNGGGCNSVDGSGPTNAIEVIP